VGTKGGGLNMTNGPVKPEKGDYERLEPVQELIGMVFRDGVPLWKVRLEDGRIMEVTGDRLLVKVEE
jgi:hypothetical protein